jgi:hypothetical protein
MRQRARQTRVEVLTSIHDLAEVNPNAEQIRRVLLERFPSTNVPSARTIRDIVKERRSPEPSAGDAWSPITADTSEAAQVMPVLAAVIAQTSGKRWQLTKEQAALIARIHGVAPDLPPWSTYVLANAYAATERSSAPVVPLDVLLAFGPWRGAVERDRYWQAVKSGAPALPAVDAVRIVPDLFTGPEAPLQLIPDGPGGWSVWGSSEVIPSRSKRPHNAKEGQRVKKTRKR